MYILFYISLVSKQVAGKTEELFELLILVLSAGGYGSSHETAAVLLPGFAINW